MRYLFILLIGGFLISCNNNSDCTNGIQDGNETGVDCGGNCPPCQTSNPSTPPNQSYSVKYIVNCPQLHNIAYYNEFQGVSTINSTSGVWELDLTLNSGDLAYVTAAISDGSSGDVLTQIFVDGTLEGEATSTGPSANCVATYNLP